MPTRRTVLAAGTAASLSATAGCLDFILGEDDLSFEATPASVSESALNATGYEERGVEDESMDHTFEAGGESRTVGITNWRVQYDKAVSVSGIPGSQRAATFNVLTTPKAEVLGETFNPIDDLSTAQLIGRAQSNYETTGSLQETGERTAQVLGTDTTVTQFEGSAELTDADLEVPLTLHVSEAVGSSDDFAIVVGGYPSPLAGSERENFFTLVDGVQHDG